MYPYKVYSTLHYIQRKKNISVYKVWYSKDKRANKVFRIPSIIIHLPFCSFVRYSLHTLTRNVIKFCWNQFHCIENIFWLFFFVNFLLKIYKIKLVIKLNKLFPAMWIFSIKIMKTDEFSFDYITHGKNSTCRL